MAWRIGQRICSAPSVFCCLELAFLALLGVSAVGWGQSSGPSNVRDCHPCSFSPGGSFPTYSFTFDLKTVLDKRTVEAIEVANQTSKVVQRLPVTGMDPVGKEEDFFFGGVDINFDGLLDLMLITRRGVANAYAAYWLFDPKTKTFTALGTYPVFRVDTQKRRLSTYERGGSAGLIHESREYAFLDGQLTLMREEKQEATSKLDVFRRVIRERGGGVMKVVNTETVRAPY